MIKPPMRKARKADNGSDNYSKERRSRIIRRRRVVHRRTVKASKPSESPALEMPEQETRPDAGGSSGGQTSIKPPMASSDGSAPLTATKPQGRTVAGGILNGKAISLPRPAYPAIARSARAAGIVVVQVIIDERGDVMSAHAISGHPLLQSVAVQAARAAKFTPTRIEGQPVKVSGKITYNFVL